MHKGENNVNNIKLIDVKPQMKDLNLLIIILEKESTSTNSKGTATTFLVADVTAAISLTVWDEQGQWMQPGDIIQLRGAYSSIFKDTLILYSGHHCNPERTGQFCLGFVEHPNLSKVRWETVNKEWVYFKDR